MARLLTYLFWTVFLGLAVMLDYSIAAKNRPTYTFNDHAERRLAEAKALVAQAVENRTEIAAADPAATAAPEAAQAPATGSGAPGLALGPKGLVKMLLRAAAPGGGGAEPAPEAQAVPSPEAVAGTFAAISAAIWGSEPAAAPATADADDGGLKPVGRLTDKACVTRAGQRSC